MHRGTVDIAYQRRRLDPQGNEVKTFSKVRKPAVLRGTVAIVRDIEDGGLLSAYFAPTGHHIVTLSQKWFLSCLRELENGLQSLTEEDVTNNTDQLIAYQNQAKSILAKYRFKDIYNDPDDYC